MTDTQTAHIQIRPVRFTYRGWRRFLPAGMVKSTWELAEPFSFFPEGKPYVEIKKGFRFDGASVPFGFSLFLPRAHPQYIEAALIHDWLYSHGDSRKEADRIFHAWLLRLGVSRLWAWPMWAAVRIGGGRGWKKKRR